MTTELAPSRAARHRPPGAPRRSPIRRAFRHFWWVAVLALAVTAGGLFGLAYAFSRVPTPTDVAFTQVVTITDDSGRDVIGEISPGENRRIVPLSKVDPVLRHAVLAAEDKTFYQHGALSYRGLLRAAWANVVRGRVAQGGSTIAQQYVKEAYVGSERTLLRKVREAMLAIKLERTTSKDKILANYLNTIYFGRGAYGVEAAARTYFRKHASRLTPAEAAQLAGSVRSPEFYARAANRRALASRRNAVLKIMLEQRWLTREQYATAVRAPVEITPVTSGSGVNAKNKTYGYFTAMVRQWLFDHYPESRINVEGWKVRTTFNQRLQQDAAEAVAQVLDEHGDPAASLVAVDPTTGRVLATYGGADFSRQQYNLAMVSTRQAGSTMKPFVLAAALQDDQISVHSTFRGPNLYTASDGHRYRNFGRESYGDISLLEATKHSVNTVYVQLMEKVGPKAVADMALRTGLADTLTSNDKPANLNPQGLPIALGANGASSLQLASAFGTWADRGLHRPPYIVETITRPNGQVVYDHAHDPKAQPRQVVDPNTADTVNYALKGVIEAGTGTAAQIGRPAAGKTGTTNDFTDARFAGYTPNLSAAVWLGYLDPRHKLDNVHGYAHVQGGSLPARIWRTFMLKAVADLGLPPVDFAQPNLDVGTVLNSTTTLPPPTAPPTLPASSLPPPTLPNRTLPSVTFPQPPPTFNTFPPTTRRRRPRP